MVDEPVRRGEGGRSALDCLAHAVPWPVCLPRRRGPAAAAKAIAAARDGKIKPACFVSQEDEFSVSRSPLIETRPPNFRETTQSQPRRPRGNRRQMFATWESALCSPFI